MNDFQAIADRVEIEALRGEFTDAVMMRDRPRLASLFTPDGALRMPDIPAEQIGREEIRAGGERLQSQWDFFVQTTHPGTILLDGDTATGRAYVQELARTLDGRQGLNYAVYHDRYQRTTEGWKFAERLYEVRYLDTSPLAGAAPHAAQDSGTNPADTTATPAPVASFTDPATAERLERVAAALRAGGFAAEILEDAAEARARIKDLVPEGASVLTGASETLRLSGIDEDINTGGRYDAIRPRLLAIDRATGADEIRRLAAGPGIRRQQRRRGHRDRLARSCLGQRQPTPCQRGRRRPRRLDRRRAKGGARPEHSAAPRRGARPPTGERPRPGGVRDAQRRQPPAHPQRGTPPRARHRAASPRGHRILTRPPGSVWLTGSEPVIDGGDLDGGFVADCELVATGRHGPVPLEAVASTAPRRLR